MASVYRDETWDAPHRLPLRTGGMDPACLMVTPNVAWLFTMESGERPRRQLKAVRVELP
ncbi:MAG: hypothetical protein GXY55_12785 [Phycisphaerae bacterium]|nr:hypothetical protein [Phycisphaerae bacterium]